MFKLKYFATLLVVLAIALGQVGSALAAPTAQDPTPITGTIQSITTETDEGGVTTVLVTLLDGTGATQTVRLSVETAVSLGLVTLDPVTNTPVADQTKVGQTVAIDPTTVIPDAEEPTEPVHPVAAILASFFGADPAVVNQYHEDGFGFGVIAQAMWMAQGLSATNPGVTADLILDAKKSGDYSAFTLPDGSTPTNWGQFKKAALGKEKKNLGVIVSGHAEPGDDTSTVPGNGQNKEKNKDNGNGKGKDKDKGNNGNGKKP